MPGHLQSRDEVATPDGYAIFDCETTGTDPSSDEIVSLAAIVLDSDGQENARFSSLVRPSGPIPAEASLVHGISDADVSSQPRFAEIAGDLHELLDSAVFVAHNAPFDLALLKSAFASCAIEYRPPGVACTLDAFRVLEPLAPDHRLQSICERRGVVLIAAHDALGDASATAALLRVLLQEGIAPETVRLDHEAFMRLRSRGDTRRATAAQIRRVFALGFAAGLSTDDIFELAARTASTTAIDALTREQVQDVYDALETAARTPINRAA
jgi:DNA polymerase III epsilon subunit family exonuclease